MTLSLGNIVTHTDYPDVLGTVRGVDNDYYLIRYTDGDVRWSHVSFLVKHDG